VDGQAGEYVWQSSNEVKRRIENYAKGLQTLGLGRQESVGVYGVNRPEWVSVFTAMTFEINLY
jgi:long-chain acyl-CoA synthetase